MLDRLRHWLFHLAAKHPSVCNANAYFTICRGEWNGLRPDWMCQKDLAVNGSCWCSKLVDHAVHKDLEG